jgi:hypothetical protein
MDADPDWYSEEEAHERMIAALRGAFMGGPMTLARLRRRRKFGATPRAEIIPPEKRADPLYMDRVRQAEAHPVVEKWEVRKKRLGKPSPPPRHYKGSFDL